MSKFCIECGQELPDAAKFCSSCGQKQAQIGQRPAPLAESAPQSASGEPTVAASQDQNQDQDLQDELSAPTKQQSAKDLGLGILTKGVVDVGPLMKADLVIQHKVELGYSDDPTNFVYTATPIDWSDLLTVSGLVGLTSQNYVMCFEPTGIALLGCIGLAKFNDDNHFIKNEDIESIDLEKAVFGAEWDHMYITVKGEVLELLVQHPTLNIIKWHRNNFKKNLTYTM